MSALDLVLRGGVAALLLLLAGLTLRDQRGRPAARFTALVAVGAAAYAILPMLVRARVGYWAGPVLALSAGNNVVFWLFARSSFDDGFRARAWHALALLRVQSGDRRGAYAAVSAGLAAADRQRAMLGATEIGRAHV